MKKPKYCLILCRIQDAGLHEDNPKELWGAFYGQLMKAKLAARRKMLKLASKRADEVPEKDEPCSIATQEIWWCKKDMYIIEAVKLKKVS